MTLRWTSNNVKWMYYSFMSKTEIPRVKSYALTDTTHGVYKSIETLKVWDYYARESYQKKLYSIKSLVDTLHVSIKNILGFFEEDVEKMSDRLKQSVSSLILEELGEVEAYRSILDYSIEKWREFFPCVKKITYRISVPPEDSVQILNDYAQNGVGFDIK